MLINEELDKHLEEKLDNFIRESLIDAAENDFVREVYEYDMTDPMEILNWYRSLYYKEGVITERGLMAHTINDLFVKYKKFKELFTICSNYIHNWCL